MRVRALDRLGIAQMLEEHALWWVAVWFALWTLIHGLCYVFIGRFLLPESKPFQMRESLRLVAIVHSVFAFVGAHSCLTCWRCFDLQMSRAV